MGTPVSKGGTLGKWSGVGRWVVQWVAAEGGGIIDKTWPCAICQQLGGPCCSTSKCAGIYRVNGSTGSKFLNCQELLIGFEVDCLAASEVGGTR